MEKILALRPFNLTILGLLQWFFYTLYLKPLEKSHTLILKLSDINIYLFISCSVIIAACGYLINDYFDYEGDRLNNKQYKWANKLNYLKAYYIFLIIGFALAQYLAYRLGSVYLSLFYIVASGLLFLYSSHLKAWSFYGNILVSLICSGAVAILLLAEKSVLLELAKQDPEHFRYIIGIFIFYSAFAYLITIVRELIKDIEDIEGDKLEGLKTFPIKYGIERAKILALFHNFVLLFLFGIWRFYFPYVHHNVVTSIVEVILVVGIIYLLVAIYFAQSKKQYSRISFLSKLMMFVGIYYLISLA